MNQTSLEYALGKLMDIGGNGEIRLEILRFSRQKSQKPGCEDFALAFRIRKEGDTPESTAAGTETGRETGSETGRETERETERETGTAAGTGTEKEAGTADTAGTLPPAARNGTEIMEA